MFTVPNAITSEQIRFGQYASRDFAPALWQIPHEFRSPSNPWAAVASNIMWRGSSAISRADTRAGIRRDAALLHIGAILHAADLTVEHREAAAAYLLSEWFTTVSCGDATAGIDVAPKAGQWQRALDA